jgi:hypothetical protein
MGSSRTTEVTLEEDEEKYIDNPMHDFDGGDTFSGPNGAGSTGKPMSRRGYEAQAAVFDFRSQSSVNPAVQQSGAQRFAQGSSYGAAASNFHSRSSANPAGQQSGAQRFARGSSYGAAVDGDFWKCVSSFYAYQSITYQ